MTAVRSAIALVAAATWFVAVDAQAQKASEGSLTLTVTEGDAGPPIPFRIHLKTQAGVSRKVANLPYWIDHHAVPGTVEIKAPKGNYTFLIERGSEYAHVTGHFSFQSFSKDQKTVPLKRAVDMAANHWFASDLHVLRPERDIELLMEAEDLHAVPLVRWNFKQGAMKEADPVEAHRKDTQVQFDGNRFYERPTARFVHPGGTLIAFGLDKPPEFAADSAPTTLDFIHQCRDHDADWIDAANPFAWDLPLWLATDGIDSIEVVHEQFGREKLNSLKIDGRVPSARAASTSKIEPHDIGQWSQEVYWHALNCGLRIVPSAGSGSGSAPNSLGYNRMYVWVDKTQFSYDTWLAALGEGRVTVTNGPMIQPFADGRLPGFEIQLPASGEKQVDIAMNMTVREPIGYVEVIRNGKLALSVRLDEWAKDGHFPPLRLDGPGWFVVRVVANVPDNYRFVMTAPWWVQSADGKEFISRRSAQFFLDWLDERAKKFGDAPEARKFFEEILSRATAE